MKIPRTAIASVTEATLQLGARKATVFLNDTTIVRATRQCPVSKRHKRTTILLSVGAPNFQERAFIKLCKKAGEPLPLRKPQLKWFKKK